MYGFIAGLILAAGMVWLVLDPILRPRAAAPEGSSADGVDPDDDLSPRAVALRALAEIEFDRETGKLSPTDYESLKARYAREAVDALRVGDAPTAATPPPPPPPPPAPQPPTAVQPAMAARPSRSALRCPVHGLRGEAGATYCADCGRRLGLVEGEACCSRCGAVLESGSRFCGRCGGRVAA